MVFWKLWKGNVFSHVCLSGSHSVHGGGPHVTSTHDALEPFPSPSPSPTPFDMGSHCTGTISPYPGFIPPSPTPRYVHTCSLRSMDGWETAGSHPTGIDFLFVIGGDSSGILAEFRYWKKFHWR